MKIFKAILKINPNAKIIQDPNRLRPEKSEVFRLWCDNSKISKLTDFKPQVSIRDGLKKTIDWITLPENLKNYKSEIYNV